ncbi:uncharacterized protein LOC116292420 [Actinia tenebrosa]|uniref:Uncharacterized protein LOC116292420 n=1 Tax=Actinia tenebrosa TaxID=6105 RepID=A0A6P8HSF1_ACTTE|nr:uncharacterized protein LOC116292420 [Actinia tenebrosa]
MEGRNIFLEAAFAGEPVVNPEDQGDKELERLERIFFTPKTRQKRKADRDKGKSSKSEIKFKNRNLELQLVREAVSKVGCLPKRVLSYVELMADQLGPVEKAYYTSIGKGTGPTKQTALRRIGRKIKEWQVSGNDKPSVKDPEDCIRE